MGMVPSQALSTAVLAGKELLWDVPENWSLEEAATVPVVYATAYYAMVCFKKKDPNFSFTFRIE